jgi:hypothetical protein
MFVDNLFMFRRVSIALLFISVILAACGATTQVEIETATGAESLPTEEIELGESVVEPRTNPTPNDLEAELSAEQDSYDIITLLPPDAIPSIDSPRFISAADAEAQYLPDEPVIGIELSGEARAYSTALLSSHEIVNDMIGGRPIAVTW